MKKNGQMGLRLLIMVSLLSLAATSIAWGERVASRYAADELLVQSKRGVPKEKIAEIASAHGGAVQGEIPQIRVKQLKVPPHALEKVKAALQRNPHIDFVERNFFAEGSLTPSDERYPSQWHLPIISAPEGWDISTGSDTVPIAVIDSGVDPTHPDLYDKLLPGYNFLEGNTDTHDVLGHGTKVSGSAAAVTDNFSGVAGVAWQNPIMPLVVLNASNWATYYDIARAITWATDQGARVLSISIGGVSSSSTLQNAVNYAWSRGAIIFASAMNNSTSTPYYPAACDHVVAVAATTSSDTRASWSNYGDWVDLSAPGASILTTTRGGGYGSVSGTSFSAPISAGLAALILSANPSLTNSQVVEIMKQNADDLGAAGFDPYFGWGRINVHASLSAAVGAQPEDPGSPPEDPPADPTEPPAEPPSEPTEPPPPAPADTVAPRVSIVSPRDGAYVSSNVKIKVSASDNVGVSRIELYIDGDLLAVASSSNTLTKGWNTRKAAGGEHVISAKAYDAAGNVGAISVAVYVD